MFITKVFVADTMIYSLKNANFFHGDFLVYFYFFDPYAFLNIRLIKTNRDFLYWSFISYWSHLNIHKIEYFKYLAKKIFIKYFEHIHETCTDNILRLGKAAFTILILISFGIEIMCFEKLCISMEYITSELISTSGWFIYKAKQSPYDGDR